MGLVDLARDIIADKVTGGASYTAFNNANAALGVGNGTTAFSSAHTDLQGASKFRKAMDATYPSRAANVITWRSTFATGEANFAWEERGVFNTATLGSGQMLSRKVATILTKTSAVSVQLTSTDTVVLV